MIANGQQDLNQHEVVSIWGKAALVLSSPFLVIGLFSVGLDLPAIKHAMAGSAQVALIPWIASVVGPAFALSSFLMGYIIEKYGYRKVYITSALVFVGAGVAPVFITNLWLVLLFRIILGLSVAGVLTASGDGIGRLPPDERPTLLGVQFMAGSLTGVGMFPIVGILANLNWHLPFVVHLFGLIVIPLAFTLPRQIKPEVTAASASPIRSAIDSMVDDLSLLVFLFGATLGFVTFVGSVFSPLYLSSIGVVNSANASVPITASALGSLAMSTVYSFIHRRIGTSGTFCVALPLVAVGLIVCGLASTLAGFTFGLILEGLGVGIWQPNLYAWAIQKNDRAPGRAFGFANGAIYSAPIFFPLFAPSVIGRDGPGSIFFLFAILTIIWACWFAVISVKSKVVRRGVV
jgi:MFS family permease